MVCLDEASKQLIGETRPPIPAEPGRPERVDYEYERKGTANLFMVFEPLAGRRRVTVTDRRTKVDFAHVLRDLLDVQYPEAERVVRVMDDLNTHKLSSLYEAFPPDEARRRIGGKDELRAEVAAWEGARNAAKCRVDWQFTTANARVKLKRLYPSIQKG